MNVKELRNALESFPPDAKVIVRAITGQGSIITVADINSVMLQEPLGGATVDEPMFVAIDADDSEDQDVVTSAPKHNPKPPTNTPRRHRLKLVK